MQRKKLCQKMTMGIAVVSGMVFIGAAMPVNAQILKKIRSTFSDNPLVDIRHTTWRGTKTAFTSKGVKTTKTIYIKFGSNNYEATQTIDHPKWLEINESGTFNLSSGRIELTPSLRFKGINGDFYSYFNGRIKVDGSKLVFDDNIYGRIVLERVDY